MTRTNLIIPYSLKDELKQYKPRWDVECKTWYYEGDNIPEELEKYVEKVVDIPYKDKDVYKKLYSSMKFDRARKTWLVSTEDYEKIISKK